MGSQIESNPDANASPMFAEVNSRLDGLLRDVSMINSFNTIGALNALKRARTGRDRLKSCIAVTYADQLRASWFVAGCSHRLTTLRTLWIQVCNEIDQKTSLALASLGVYLACASVLIATVSIALSAATR